MNAGHPLHDLATRYGVDVGYWDWQGRHHDVAESTLRAVLTAFGVDAGTDAGCAEALAALEQADAARVLPPCRVVRAGRAAELDVGGPTPPTDAWVEFEDGGRTGVPLDAARLLLPAGLPLGYHQLAVLVDGTEHRTQLVVTPDRIDWPAALDTPAAGLAVQLYSVRSAHSWGIGDLADLTTLATWAARSLGADFVLVNPMHAAEVAAAVNPSPYLPTSRRFGNPAYLRIENIPEAADVDLDDYRTGPRAGAGELIDRDTIWAAQLDALERIFAIDLSPERQAAFDAFREREGEPLDRFATWCALSTIHGNDWRTWPAELQDPRAATARSRPPSRSSAGCNGCWPSSSPRPSATPAPPGCGWASCTTSRSG